MSADPRADRPVTARAGIEDASRAALERLSGLPTVLIAGLVGLGVLAALLVDNRWSALALLPALALIGWLTYLAWPSLRAGQRLLRLLVLGALAAWAVSRLV